MKGLVLKDLYILKGFSRQYGLILAIMLVWSFMMKSFSFMSVYFVIISGNIVMSSVSLDEAVSFNRFALTAPIERKMLVRSKYLLFLLSVGSGGLLGFGLNLLVHFFSSGSDKGFEMEGIMVTMSLFMLMNAASLPMIFKLGVEKARYIYIGAMLVCGIVILAGVNICKDMGIPIEAVEKIPPLLLEGVLVGMDVLVLLISYAVSVKMVEKRDF